MAGFDTQTVTLSIRSSDWQLEGQVTVPTGPTRIGDLLPLARALSDAVVGEATAQVTRSGEAISCKQGCGACCRHLVAISEPEARRLRAVVAAMPAGERAQVLARFAAARSRLHDAGLLSQLEHGDRLDDDAYRSLSRAYFEQQVACPFLVDESCSIYTERPITCREYLVTSPAENCARSTADSIRRVRMPLRVFNAVARWQVPPSTHVLERWVPLIVALDWADAHPDDPPPRPGLELLSELLDHLTGKSETGAQPVAP